MSLHARRWTWWPKIYRCCAVWHLTEPFCKVVVAICILFVEVGRTRKVQHWFTASKQEGQNFALKRSHMLHHRRFFLMLPASQGFLTKADTVCNEGRGMFSVWFEWLCSLNCLTGKLEVVGFKEHRNSVWLCFQCNDRRERSTFDLGRHC